MLRTQPERIAAESWEREGIRQVLSLELQASLPEWSAHIVAESRAETEHRGEAAVV